MPDNNKNSGKPDLKSRLGKKRLRTASQKSLKQELPPKQSEAPSMPSSPQMPAASSPQMPAASSPQMPAAADAPVQDGMAAPQDSMVGAPEVDFSAVTKKNKLTLIIVTLVFALPALGFGYCFGHRREQVAIANQATKDAKPLLENIKKVNDSLNTLYNKFATPPDTYSGWLNIVQAPNVIAPNLELFAKAKINWIPLPKQRREFMHNIISYYTYVFLAQNEYARIQSLISGIKQNEALLKEIDKTGKKLIGEKAGEYYMNFKKGIKAFELETLKAINKKLTDKKATKFLVLVQGSPYKSIIVPNDARRIKKVKVCPIAKKVCPKNKKKCKDSEKTCKPNEKVDVKAYRYKGMYFLFRVDNGTPIEQANFAVPFDEIAQRSLFELIKYEIENPLTIKFEQAIRRFYALQSYIKMARKAASKIVPILEKASMRKIRGFI